MDLEPVSRYNPPTEPRGQERRFSRPTPATVGVPLAAVPAGIAGTTAITATVTITAASNDVLSFKVVSTAGLTNVTIPPGVYASGVALAKAVDGALGVTGLASAFLNSGGFLVVQSKVGGAGSYIEIGGGTFNTPGGLAAGTFTMPDAAAIITALFPPPAGPLDVSPATVKTTIGSGGSEAQRDALIGAIAPHFVETDAFFKSFQVGMISGYLSPTYNPDPSRVPALTPGPAITVVKEDGTTVFTAPLTVITAAVASAGNLTITGTNLGDPEYQATVVRVYSADGSRSVQIHQKKIQTPIAGAIAGVISPTSIVIPSPLLAGLGVAGSKVQLQYTSLVNVKAADPNKGKPELFVVT
jgi:hypothetical protein